MSSILGNLLGNSIFNTNNLTTSSILGNTIGNSIFSTNNLTTMENNMKETGSYCSNSLDESNAAPRCPVSLLLDVSGSMSGEPINELNQGLHQFISETSSDETASMSVELEIITFDSKASVLMPFTPIYEIEHMPAPLSANGSTCMGAALRMANEDLRNRRIMYRQAGISSYKPWVILMTDGEPNDDWQAAAMEMRELGERGKIQFIGIELGSGANHSTLCQILPSNPGPLKLKGLRFKQFFRWLTDSLRSVSLCDVSYEKQIDFTDEVTSWAELAGM